MSVFTRTVEVEAQGTAGAASGSSRLGVGPAKLLGVKLVYNTAAPSTTDITIVSGGRTLFTRSNSKVDAWFQPRENAHKTDTTAIPAGDNPWEPQLVHEYLEVQVNQCDPLTIAVRATLFFEA